MSETVLVALIVAVPPTLTAWLAYVQARRVDSNLDAVKSDLVIANQRIAALLTELGVK